MLLLATTFVSFDRFRNPHKRWRFFQMEKRIENKRHTSAHQPLTSHSATGATIPSHSATGATIPPSPPELSIPHIFIKIRRAKSAGYWSG